MFHEMNLFDAEQFDCEEDLRGLSDEALVLSTKSLVGEENRIHARILRHLSETESRKLFLKLGFGSLFESAIKELGYSESAADRRIQAMRLMNHVPEIETKIKEASISLTTAAQVQTFLKAEANLERLKSLLSHVEHDMSYENLLLQISEFALDKLDPERKEQRARQRSQKAKTQRKATPAPEVKTETEKQNRHIPAELQREIWLRDEGCCTYENPKSGKRCGSTHQVQIDHVMPFALGGEHSSENLRLLCAAHNRWRAEGTFSNRRESASP